MFGSPNWRIDRARHPSSWDQRALLCVVRPVTSRCGTAVRVQASAPDDERLRREVKKLTRLFYASGAQQQQQASGEAGQPPPLSKAPLDGLRIERLPLWRVEWSVLPGMQEVLHVLAPHYVHLFEHVFSGPRPWLFGHIYLPGGSSSLGSPSHALASGSQAPLVGVLMQVTRAVRLRDGKFLVLATAMGRIKVVRCVREVPFSEADVELMEDEELLEAHSSAATAAVMQAAADDVSVSSLMAVSNLAAREAAAASHWAWMKGYELSVATKQAWGGPGPREGDNDAETYSLVHELAEQGVAEVLPLPDGVVIGRCNLAEVAAAADAVVATALHRVAADLNKGGTQQQGAALDGDSMGASNSSGAASSPLSSTEGPAVIRSLNTTAERGISFQAPETKELTRSRAASSSLGDVMLLEAAVWQQLDILAALSSRVKGRRHSLPFGLLQLRPPQPQPQHLAAHAAAGSAAAATAAAAAGTAGSSGGAARSSDASSSSGGSAAVFEGSWLEGLTPAAAEEMTVAGEEQQPSSTQSQEASQPQSQSFSSSDSSSDVNSSIDSSTQSARPPRDASAGAQQQQQQQWGALPGAYAYAASEGTDVTADPLWPPLRRAAKLSWAAALATGQVELEQGELRQALLEAPSIAARLRFVLGVLQKHAKVMAALAAVQDMQQ